MSVPLRRCLIETARAWMTNSFPGAKLFDNRVASLAALLTETRTKAQAPTTAASVLTEDEVWKLYAMSGSRSDFAQSIIDRLTSTVGAPAPAPTHARQCGYWLDLNCSCGFEARQ